MLKRFKSDFRDRVATALTLFFALVFGAPSASADTAVRVDCAAASGGDGSKRQPFNSITAALSSARAAAADGSVTIDVAAGVCGRETLPIEIDFPVHLRGSRSAAFDAIGLPLDDQDHDTLVTWTPPAPVPASVNQLAFFRITGDNVRISRLSIDGKIMQPRTSGPPAPAPTGVLAHNATNLALERLRIVGAGMAVRTQGAGGVVRDSYLGRIVGGLVVSGGSSLAAPTVRIESNRVDDYSNNGLAILGAGPAGNSIRAAVTGNDFITTYVNTGPSNPAGVRIGPIFSGGPHLDGSVDAALVGNAFRGTPRYGIIVNSPQTVRRADGRHYTGTVTASFAANLLDRQSITRAPSLVTFTNSRATEFPCELNPASTVQTCPSLMGNPPQYWEYLEHSQFDLRHSGELDGALIDHPAAEPSDGRVLGNELVMNGATVENQTFVVVP